MSSTAFVGNTAGVRREPITQTSVQKMLDENTQLIQVIIDYQNQGKARECHQYQQILHRNLIFLATLADSTVNQQPPAPNPMSGQSTTAIIQPQQQQQLQQHHQQPNSVQQHNNIQQQQLYRQHEQRQFQQNTLQQQQQLQNKQQQKQQKQSHQPQHQEEIPQAQQSQQLSQQQASSQLQQQRTSQSHPQQQHFHLQNHHQQQQHQHKQILQQLQQQHQRQQQQQMNNHQQTPPQPQKDTNSTQQSSIHQSIEHQGSVITQHVQHLQMPNISQQKQQTIHQRPAQQSQKQPPLQLQQIQQQQQPQQTTQAQQLQPQQQFQQSKHLQQPKHLQQHQQVITTQSQFNQKPTMSFSSSLLNSSTFNQTTSPSICSNNSSLPVNSPSSTMPSPTSSLSPSIPPPSSINSANNTTRQQQAVQEFIGRMANHGINTSDNNTLRALSNYAQMGSNTSIPNMTMHGVIPNMIPVMSSNSAQGMLQQHMLYQQQMAARGYPGDSSQFSQGAGNNISPSAGFQ